MIAKILEEIDACQKQLAYYKKYEKALSSSLGQEMEKTRKSKKLKVRDICRDLNISIGFYYDIEQGNRKPSSPLLQKIKSIFS
jgi:predicted transcriptional regulator